MILRPQLQPTDDQGILDYYLHTFPEVHVVSCSKCKADLAIEVRCGEMTGYKPNELGFTVLPFGDKLLASRVRTDGLMGYQCVCGNDTRGNDIEQELSPTGTFLPHEVAAIHHRYAQLRYKPKFRIRGNKEHHETFVRERIK